MSETYAADLTPAQALAHEKIKLLQEVYDAAVDLLDVEDAMYLMPENQALASDYGRKLSKLSSTIWNTKPALKRLG